jgi:hypothetical protein
VVSNNANENIEFVSGSASLNGGYLQYINRTSASTRPDMNYYLASGGGSHKFYTNDLLRATLDSAGNLGLGVTPSAWTSSFKVLEIPNGGSMGAFSTTPVVYINSNAFFNGSSWIYKTSAPSTRYQLNGNNGTHDWFIAPSGTAGNAITFTQAMTLDASGRLVVGHTSAQSTGQAYPIQVKAVGGGAGGFGILNSSNVISGGLSLGSSSDNSLVITADPDNLAASSYIGMNVDGTERARITSDGHLLVGKTTTDLATAGSSIESNGVVGIGVGSVTSAMFINRQSNDGTLIQFRQANADEGSISVSGSTVSYNAFAGSHWSQLQDGSKPEILRGTVMESIDELCEWPDEPTTERLCRSKVSDTVGSKRVYGVFMCWDEDWTSTNDMLVTSLGAFVCRVNAGVTVQMGDLLESNGDGTARVQADDIIRSSTIGKVTSTVKTHEYDDGSYCVPTVLYCG